MWPPGEYPCPEFRKVIYAKGQCQGIAKADPGSPARPRLACWSWDRGGLGGCCCRSGGGTIGCPRRPKIQDCQDNQTTQDCVRYAHSSPLDEPALCYAGHRFSVIAAMPLVICVTGVGDYFSRADSSSETLERLPERRGPQWYSAQPPSEKRRCRVGMLPRNTLDRFPITVIIIKIPAAIPRSRTMACTDSNSSPLLHAM